MIETDYMSPAMYCILHVVYENWVSFFSKEELAELNEHAKAPPIDYPELPVQMQQFSRNIPDTDNLETIYIFLEVQQFNFTTQSSFQSALLLFKNKYSPVNN
ncbi:hypothetical protein PS15m_012195 [Mucor circinelloides]